MLPKKFRFISSAALVVLGLIIAVVVLTRHGQIKASAAEKPAVATQNPAPTAAAQPQELPPGTIAVAAKAVTTAQFLARGHLTESQYMTVAEYVDAIAKANGGKTTFKKVTTSWYPALNRNPLWKNPSPLPKTLKSAPFI
jgi:Flp pilus assembly protein CpaB